MPVSLGPVGGGLVTGLADLARLAGSQMFAVDHLREIGFRATEGEDQEELGHMIQGNLISPQNVMIKYPFSLFLTEYSFPNCNVLTGWPSRCYPI